MRNDYYCSKPNHSIRRFMIVWREQLAFVMSVNHDWNSSLEQWDEKSESFVV